MDTQIQIEKNKMNDKIIDYLDNHLSQRVMIEHEIIKQDLHNSIMKAVEKAVEDNVIQINTIEDFCILAEMELMLMHQGGER